MKIIITTILIIPALWAFAQEPYSGTYFTSKKDIGFESDIFQFQDDGTFSYVFFTCTGTGLGKGEYEVIAGDSLRLQFTDCLRCDDIKQIQTAAEPADSLDIDLVVKEWESGIEIAGANVYFPGERVGAVSNESGLAKFTIPKLKEKQTLRIQFIGYDPVDIEIPANTSQIKETVNLTFLWVYDSSHTKTYKILKWTRSKLKLRRYTDITITYDRLNPNKTDYLIKGRMGEMGYKLYAEKIKAPASYE